MTSISLIHLPSCMSVGCTSLFKMTSIISGIDRNWRLVGCTSLFKMTSIGYIEVTINIELDVPHFLR